MGKQLGIDKNKDRRVSNLNRSRCWLVGWFGFKGILNSVCDLIPISFYTHIKCMISKDIFKQGLSSFVCTQ